MELLSASSIYETEHFQALETAPIRISNTAETPNLLTHALPIKMASLSLTGLIFAATLLLFIVRSKFQSRAARTLPLPPGPKGLPLVGNVNDLPPIGAVDYQHWLQFKERYGSLSSLTIMGQTMIIIHDKTVALELMEKRASRHSGRPSMKFAMEM